MKHLIIIVLAFGGLVRAQDTIRFRSGEVKAVKVNEVGLNSIRYNRFDNLTGPTYVAPKNDVTLIKYASGQVDSFRVSAPASVAGQKENTGINDANAAPIVIRGTDLFYKGRPMGEGKLKKVISEYPDANKRVNLFGEFEVMRGYKKKQLLFFFTGLGVGLGVPYIGFVSTVLTGSAVPLLVALPVGIAAGTTGIILSVNKKKKRLEQKARVARMYNDLAPAN